MLKKTFDFLVSLILLMILTPLFLLIALYIKIDSRGPVFFKQNRVGKNKLSFKVFKFRSMYYEGNNIGQIDEGASLKKSRENYHTTKKNDPRITKAGIRIRKYYLDELPQIINVLKGEMSLVGPRPDAPAQEADYSSKAWTRRHTIRPGITGLAQIYKENPKFSAKMRIALDLYYVKKSGLIFDMYILFQTFVSVLKGSSKGN
jgi:undecaprenyl phosphate N,N'-diacetylbacillosamine 1-phosphate transferase